LELKPTTLKPLLPWANGTVGDPVRDGRPGNGPLNAVDPNGLDPTGAVAGDDATPLLI